MKRVYYILGLAALILLSLAVLAVPVARAEEEPTPGVARVSLIHGDVSSMRGDSGDWVAVTVNAPLVRGDKISTGERSQTEIQLDYANVLRLGPAAEVTIADLSRTRIQIQVAQGLVNFTVFKGTEADVEIDTPNMAVAPLGEGSYRIQVDSASQTQLIVRKGKAQVSTPDGSAQVDDGRIIDVRGTDHPEYQIASAPRNDDWDKWNKERDDAIKDAQSYRYANRYYTGAQDLDRNGHWVYIPDYEWCWTPYVNAGWVPYRYGSWVWEPFWGWTWVSYEPWGWAPYHYGRWFSYGSSWYWWPGYSYYGYYPTWAPAYVSFLGFGFGGRNWGFGFGFGFNSIGWCPLGPYDTYHPWWGRHNSYNVVNITNITNVTNVTNLAGSRRGGFGRQSYTSNLQAALTNSNVRGAISHVSTEDFVRGRIPRQQQPIDAATLRQGQLVQGTLPAVPTRESLRPVDRPVNTASLPRNTNAAQNFFTRRQPPATNLSFNQRAAEIRQMVEQRNPMQAAGRGTSSGAASALAGKASSASPAARGASNAQAQPGAESRLGMSNANRPTLSDAQQALRNRGREISGTGPSASPSPTATPGATLNRPSAAPSRGNMPLNIQGGEQTGWRRFGQSTAAAPNAGGNAAEPAAYPTLAQRTNPSAAASSRQQTQPAPQAQPTPQASRPSWQRFGTGQPRAVPNRPATATPGREAQPAPQASPGRSAGARSQGTPSARPAPASQGGGQEGFQRFTAQPKPAPTAREPARSAPQAEPRAAAPGWSRFSRSQAPRSADRSPLEIRKSIVTERPAPRSGEGGGSRSNWWGGGGRSAPATSPRNFEGGGSRSGWGGGGSAPAPRSLGSSSGGGRSFSAPAPRSSGGGGGIRGGGGGRSSGGTASRGGGQHGRR
jgi:hypothetical protein